MHHFLFFVVFS